MRPSDLRRQVPVEATQMGGGARVLARFADAWNWWGWDETIDEIIRRMTPMVAELERAGVEVAGC